MRWCVSIRVSSAAGRPERGRTLPARLYFGHATEEQFCEVIERVLGRKVRAFISGLDTDSDVAAELFYLES